MKSRDPLKLNTTVLLYYILLIARYLCMDQSIITKNWTHIKHPINRFLRSASKIFVSKGFHNNANGIILFLFIICSLYLSADILVNIYNSFLVYIIIIPKRQGITVYLFIIRWLFLFDQSSLKNVKLLKETNNESNNPKRGKTSSRVRVSSTNRDNNAHSSRHGLTRPVTGATKGFSSHTIRYNIYLIKKCSVKQLSRYPVQTP